MASQETPHRDPLTGLSGYEDFLKAFDEEILKAEQEGAPISLALVDIDNMKAINDEYGHEIGDLALKWVAKHLQDIASASGIVFRYRIDEFVLLLPNTEKEDAFLLLEKARASAEKELKFEAADKTASLNVPFSAGISSYPEDGSRRDDVIRKAEEAMIRAKTTGRSKTCLSRQEKMVTKTSHYTRRQLEDLAQLAKREGVGEAVLLREALDDLLRKYPPLTRPG